MRCDNWDGGYLPPRYTKQQKDVPPGQGRRSGVGIRVEVQNAKLLLLE